MGGRQGWREGEWEQEQSCLVNLQGGTKHTHTLFRRSGRLLVVLLTRVSNPPLVCELRIQGPSVWLGRRHWANASLGAAFHGVDAGYTSTAALRNSCQNSRMRAPENPTKASHRHCHHEVTLRGFLRVRNWMFCYCRTVLGSKHYLQFIDKEAEAQRG